jgi:flagellar basal-body rod modification protein FlgD
MTTTAIPSGLLSSLTAVPTSAGTAASGTRSNQNINEQDFLQLFIAQLQNQDPLSPQDPSQLTAQLAQFSSLEQLTGVNTRLDTLNAVAKASDGTTLISLIGKQVDVDGSSIALTDGKAPSVGYHADKAYDRVTASVSAQDGTVVRVVELGPQTAGDQSFQFDGLDSNGQKVPDGTYKLQIAASNTGDKIATQLSLTAKATVDGVDLSTDPPVLLVNGLRIPLDQVKEVRAADQSS